MVRLSVIIPVYNVEEYLPACLDSVLRQNVPDMEVICVNDASPDRCGEILSEYAEKDPRIRIITQTVNTGQGKARNAGLDTAEGRYVYFLDSDDYVTDGALETMLGIAQEHDLDGVIGEWDEYPKRIPGNKREVSEHRSDETISGADLLQRMFGQDTWMCYIQRQVWKREHLLKNRVRFPERYLIEDEWFSFLALFTAERVRYIPDVVFVHRNRAGSAMSGPNRESRFLGTLDAYLRIAAFLSERQIRHPAALRYLRNMHYMLKLRAVDTFSSDLEASERMYAGALMYRFLPVTERMLRLKGWESCLSERGYRRWFLYGTGQVARRLYPALLEYGEWEQIEMAGFLKTRRQPEERFFLGRPVIGWDEYRPEEGDLIVVAVGKGLQKEIVPVLETAGVDYFAP